jgi:hypothetical protein
MYQVGDTVRFIGAGPWSEIVSAVVEVVDGAFIIGLEGSEARKRARGEELRMAKGTTTYITHPDGTRSQRTSATRTYTHALEVCESAQVIAAAERVEADHYRSERAKFIEAVKGGRVLTDEHGQVYVKHSDGDTFWIGAQHNGETLDRKAGVRWKLSRYDADIAKHADAAADADAVGDSRYGAWSWHQSEANALRALADVTKRMDAKRYTYRVVAVDAS